MKIKFNYKYFILFIIFLIIEIIIGRYINDWLIRPYGGDFLVIFLVYYFVRSFVEISSFRLVLAVLLFTYCVEILQYFQIADVLNIKIQILRIMVGSSFSWGDMVAYTLGAICCYSIEKYTEKRK